MSTFNEQLQAIETLRTQRNEQGETMYGLQAELFRTERALQISRQKPTPAEQTAAVAALRAEIAGLEAQLTGLGNSEIVLLATIRQYTEVQKRVDFLRKRVEGLQAAIAALETQLEAVLNATTPDQQKIAELNKAIETAKARLSETQSALAVAQSELQQLHAGYTKALEDRKRINDQKAQVRVAISEKEEKIRAVTQSSGQSFDELQNKVTELKNQYAAAKEEWTNIGKLLGNKIDGIYTNRDPRSAVAQMNDTTPFLLLPVRIETRFVKEHGKNGTHDELWVRVYPDDIAVHTHEKQLTEREVDAGEAYWKIIFGIVKNAVADKATQKTDAWKNFASLFGPSRSSWVARSTRPVNWSSVNGLATEDQLTFPAHDLTKPAAWTRAPRAHVMPDRLVVMLYVGDAIVKEVTGNTIPDELFVGPEPLDLVTGDEEANDSFITKDGQLTFGTRFDWASDFGRAVESGMGFRIPITSQQGSEGFDKILVLGVMASSNPTKGQTLVEELIDNHHYSPKGFSLLQQGAPTNNTDDSGSGYSVNDSIDSVQEVTGEDIPLFNEHSSADGRRLADALGVNYNSLQYVSNANLSDYANAVAMNKALYPATLGYYFDSQMSPVLSEASRDKLRDFFVTKVTGRGPLPAIRIGDQPYGILLTSDFSRWKETSHIKSVDPFNTMLLKVLHHFDTIWNSMLPKLMYAGKPGVDSSDVLMNVLGLQAGSVSFNQRTGYSLDYLKNLVAFEWDGEYFTDTIMTALREWYMMSFLQTKFNYTPATGEAHPELFRLIYQHYHTPLDVSNLVSSDPLSETDSLQEYDTAQHKNYLDWLCEADTISKLYQQSFNGAEKPTSLLYLQLRHALLLQLNKTAVQWMKRYSVDTSVTETVRTFYNIRPAGDLTRWEVLRGPVGNVSASHPKRVMPVADFLLTAGSDLEETAFLGEMRDSLSTLSGLPTAQLERCFTEHIDSCTYRLDAWQTGIFSQRLESLRGGTTSQPNKGVYLGAFGWVENIRPITRTPARNDVPAELLSKTGKPLFEDSGNGGFVHAPSINHAAAAALLRSGYMSHATPAEPDVMAVNLSSERVRRSLFILQGMRNGQTLEALLGYQFERGLHDRVSANAALGLLNSFIYDIRVAFPIKTKQVETSGATETVEAYDVVNGATLAGSATVNWSSVVKLDPPALTPAMITVLNEEKDKLADTLDAVNDLLLAESAYQMVQGNFDRTNAVLGSMKDAYIPPDLDVIKTPRSTRFTFTNKVTLHFPHLDPLDPASAAWPGATMTPRALMEPGINFWLGEVLGAPENIQCTVFEELEDGTLETPLVISANALDLQPIDFVLVCGKELSTGAGGRTGVSELESRIAWAYRSDRGLDETSRVRISFGAPKNEPGKVTFSELLPMLRGLHTLVSGSRALSDKDYFTSATGSGTPTEGYDYNELRTRVATLQTALGTLLGNLRLLPISATIEGTVVFNLGDALVELRNNELDFTSITFTFATIDAVTLQQYLSALSAFGIADSFPRFQSNASDDSKAGLLAQAMEVEASASAALSSSVALLTAADADQKISGAIDACKAILGSAFNVLPAFTLSNEVDLLKSDTDRLQLLSHATGTLQMPLPADEWMSSSANVRPKLAAWENIRLLYETFQDKTLALRPVQLPYREKDSWLAVQFPDNDPLTGEPFNISRDTMSVIVHGESAFQAGSLRSGILLDEWNESIPAREQNTGITFHYNRPNAMPPQSLLLAVPSEIKGHWNWDELVNILNDTLRRAKLRAVEPQLIDANTDYPELSVLLPSIISEFSQYDLNVSLDLRLNLTLMAPLLTGFYLNPNLNSN